MEVYLKKELLLHCGVQLLALAHHMVGYWVQALVPAGAHAFFSPLPPCLLFTQQDSPHGRLPICGHNVDDVEGSGGGGGGQHYHWKVI